MPGRQSSNARGSLALAAGRDRRTAGPPMAATPRPASEPGPPPGGPPRPRPPGRNGSGMCSISARQPVALVGVEHRRERHPHRVERRAADACRASRTICRVVLRATLLENRPNRVALRVAVRRDDRPPCARRSRADAQLARCARGGRGRASRRRTDRARSRRPASRRAAVIDFMFGGHGVSVADARRPNSDDAEYADASVICGRLSAASIGDAAVPRAPHQLYAASISDAAATSGTIRDGTVARAPCDSDCSRSARSRAATRSLNPRRKLVGARGANQRRGGVVDRGSIVFGHRDASPVVRHRVERTARAAFRVLSWRATGATARFLRARRAICAVSRVE